MNDDYISRKEALKRFTFYNGDRIPEKDIDGFTNTISYRDAKSVIRSIPSEDVRPVVYGEWEWHGPCRDSKGTYWATCSVCKTRQRIGDYENFCPHCGADMRGKANE